MQGLPGVGKTLLAKTLPSILPQLTEEEMFEVMQLYSCAGIFRNGIAILDRPFREIHPSISLAALLGGGNYVKPGEVSLAHHGVLFLDEIAEFSRPHLESLRQPLEAKIIHLARNNISITLPAKFTLIASMNPCPCGYFGDIKKECSCEPSRILKYQRKISGPIMDRLDLVIKLTRPEFKKAPEKTVYTSKQMREKVIQARKIQKQRFKQSMAEKSPSQLNSEMTIQELTVFCTLNPSCQEFMSEINEKLGFTGRNYHQLLKTARTIADLSGGENISLEDLGEALQYRHRSSRNEF